MHYSIYLHFPYESKLFFCFEIHYTKLNKFSAYLAFYTLAFYTQLMFLSVLLETDALLEQTTHLPCILKGLLLVGSTEFLLRPDSYMLLNSLVKIRKVVILRGCYKQYKH